MNALCYKIVFSKRLGALVAVGEHTSGQGKAAGTGVRTAFYPSSAVGATAGEFVGSLKAVFASVALTCFTATTIAAGPAAKTLPTGYSVNSGHVAVSTSGADMTIKQTTDKASVNWQSFSIGSAASVNIQQNSASSVLLNRVVGNDPSQIFGKLTANGQVILINPNGIVFGKGGSVTASAFTASTFGMTEDDFNKGKRKFSRNGSTANVTVEEGASINTTTPSGYIALIASTVNNQGSISAKQGSVVLAAAETVTLPSALTGNVGIPLSSKVRLELSPSTINASVENGGTITTDGGQVLMQAAAVADAVASVTHTGTIDTTGEQGGAVTLQADHGIIKATGTIKASSKNAKNKGGDIIIGRDEVTGVLAASADVSGANLESQGGFVETSGQYLKTDGIKVKAKEWLLDPSDITISSGNDAGYSNSGGTYTPDASAATSVVKVDTIQTAISNGTSVTITTTNTGTKGAGAGNITINDALTFTNNSDDQRTLTLIADNGIIVNKAITTNLGTGSGLVDISMTAKGNYNGTDEANASSKGITLNSTITTNGDVTLHGTNQNTGGGRNNGGVVFNGGSRITAKEIKVTGIQKRTGTTDANGIAFSGNTTFNSTGTSTFDGTSSSIGNASAGIYVEDGATLNLNSGAGSMHFKGNNTNNGYRGIRLGYVSPATTNINTDGNVIFGTDTSAKQTFLRAKLNVNSGSVTMQGSEVQLYDGAVLTAKNGTTINLTGKLINLGQAGSAIINKETEKFDLNIKGDTVTIQGGASVDAGSGKVTVNTLTPLREIQVGANDTSLKMGLTNAELGLIKAGQVVIGDTDTKGTITVAGTTSTNAAMGHLTLQTGGDITVSASLKAGAGKNLTLLAKGDVTVGAAISQAGNGNIVVAAGFDKQKQGDDPSGHLVGQVKRDGSGSVTNGTGTAKTYIYTGSVSGSTVMGNLNGSFTTLLLDNTTLGSPQNAQSNAAYNSSLGITGGNTASMQVLYREKIGVNLTGVLVDANKTYGEIGRNTDNTEARTALNAANTFTTWTTAGSDFKIKRAALVNTMSLTGDTYSSSNRLNAKTDGYEFTSSTYTLSNGPKLFVEKLSLSAIYAANNKEFDGTNNAIVAGILKDKVSGDVVNLKHSSATFDSSDIGNAKVVTVSGLTLEGADAGNYKLDSTINAGKKATTTANITARPQTPPTPAVPTNNAGARVKVPVGSANPFALASAEDLADDTCSANSVENCYCEESAVSQGVDICYEPKTAAKGSVR